MPEIRSIILWENQNTYVNTHYSEMKYLFVFQNQTLKTESTSKSGGPWSKVDGMKEPNLLKSGWKEQKGYVKGNL